MKIHNIRIGFATNSSSSHSILLNCTAPEDPDSSWQFGWQDFLLKSREDKARYMLSQLFEGLQSAYSGNFEQPPGHQFNLMMSAADIVKSLGYDFTDEVRQEFNPTQNWLDAGVDHQSVFSLPTEYNSGKLSVDFYRDLFKYIVENEKVSLQGGNDNDEYRTYRDGDSDPLDALRESGQWSCRRDGAAWTLFRSTDGTRMTFEFQ